jgi:preprotein translocase subunit Sec63
VLDRVRGRARTERSWDDRTASAYQILGVEIEASPQMIRRAYLELVRLWHPDRYADEPARRHEAEATTKRINEAYEVLVRRAADGSRRSRRSPQAGRNRSPRATSSPTPYHSTIHDGSHAARILIIPMIILMICLMTLVAIFAIAYVIDMMDSPYGAYPLYR